MNSFKKQLSEIVDNIGAWYETGGLIVAIICLIGVVGITLKLLSPIITFLIAFGLTVHALKSGIVNAAMALVGLTLFTLSFAIGHQDEAVGIALAVTVWGVGFMLWLVAVTRSFPRAWATITA